MSGRDAGPSDPLAGGAESLPEGEETAPPGTRAMGLVRWALVALMALGAAGAWLHHARATSHGSATAATYRCPMHPSVLQDHPGSCPVCGMDLVAAPAASERGHASEAPPPGAAAAAGKYACPMHPEVASDDPQATCPRCGGMKLVARTPDGAAGRGVPGLVPVEVAPDRTQLMGLRTAQAVRRPLAASVRAFGYVSANERSVAVVTARASGWIEELRASQLGQRVARGQVLLTLNSGELVSAQQAYLDATRWKRNIALQKPGELSPAAQAVDRDAIRRLRLYGVAKEDMAEIERRNEAVSALPIRAPQGGFVARKSVLPGQYVAAGTELLQIADLSTVWVVVDLAEQDMERVAVGQRARFLPASAPGTSLPGKVDFLYPAVNPETRTLQARIQLENPGLKLRPGAFGDVVIEAPAAEAITVPSEAVVDTGEHQYVFVARPGGRFEPRAVRAGASSEGRTEVLAGVVEGETVVTTANFLLDSESRLHAAVEAHAAPAVTASAR